MLPPPTIFSPFFFYWSKKKHKGLNFSHDLQRPCSGAPVDIRKHHAKEHSQEKRRKKKFTDIMVFIKSDWINHPMLYPYFICLGVKKEKKIRERLVVDSQGNGK